MSSGAPQDHGSVFCQIHTIPSLTDAPPYFALSYTWGDASKTKRIYLDEYPIQVTESLEALMQQMRMQRANSVLLWIHAICINRVSLDFYPQI